MVARSVDEYLADLPADQRQLLQGLRERIARLVPEATQAISYGMPAFKLDGKFLLSYAGWKSHCSLYPLTDSFLSSHADEIEPFDRTKGSLHFTPQKPLPDRVLDDLILARVADVRRS
ncbi:MAG TPA: DUF1801 domain-containing protein [Candidatus Limnocylindrales bacterium]|jgi:uncharacterized protein YdhG (YjbR/CyaY superfamily)